MSIFDKLGQPQVNEPIALQGENKALKLKNIILEKKKPIPKV